MSELRGDGEQGTERTCGSIAHAENGAEPECYDAADGFDGSMEPSE